MGDNLHYLLRDICSPAYVGHWGTYTCTLSRVGLFHNLYISIYRTIKGLPLNKDDKYTLNFEFPYEWPAWSHKPSTLIRIGFSDGAIGIHKSMITSRICTIIPSPEPCAQNITWFVNEGGWFSIIVQVENWVKWCWNVAAWTCGIRCVSRALNRCESNLPVDKCPFLPKGHWMNSLGGSSSADAL